MNMNPMQLMKAMKNPQQFIQSMMGNSNVMSNPMAKNIMNMAQKGDLKGIEQFGRNIAKERGVDFDSEFERFKSKMDFK
nr:MAG TPA: hypothetical protein [Caudoviricetes sp.]